MFIVPTSRLRFFGRASVRGTIDLLDDVPSLQG